jgi:hypothetical protein
MKSKYNQIIDADADENNTGILKRAQEKLVSEKDEKKRYDILVASREGENSVPKAMRGDQRGVAKSISNVITGNANVLNNNERAQSILGNIADVTMSKKNRIGASTVIEYRVTNKKGKKNKSRK